MWLQGSTEEEKKHDVAKCQKYLMEPVDKWLRVLATNSDDLISVPETHMLEGETQLPPNCAGIGSLVPPSHHPKK